MQKSSKILFYIFNFIRKIDSGKKQQQYRQTCSKQEQQRVAVGPGNAHFMCIRQESLRAARAGTGIVLWPAAAAALAATAALLLLMLLLLLLLLGN